MQLGYGQVEAVLASVLRVAPAKVGTLRARLQDLQRRGFPEETRVGRGGRARYTAEGLLKLALAFEMLDVGIAPRRVTKMILENWQEIREGFRKASAGDAVEGRGRVHIALMPSALIDWRGGDEFEHEMAELSAVMTAGELAKSLEGGFLYPVAVIDANGLVTRVNDHLQRILKDAGVPDGELPVLTAEIEAWPD